MHEIFSSYTEAEKKLSQNQNQLYNLRNFIITKKRDMNYEAIKDECKDLLEEINKLVVKNSN